MKRCTWVTNDAIYREYHDKEWGVPVYQDQKLFEMLILEGAQAGLSWITVLKKRKAYEIAFDGFNPECMAHWSHSKIESLSKDQTIIRNRLKIEAARVNARIYLKMMDSGKGFGEFLWSFVKGSPIQNAWKQDGQIPRETIESKAMARALKKQGFKFTGPTICYAFMQAVGMVNDHLVDCFRYDQITHMAVTTCHNEK